MQYTTLGRTGLRVSVMGLGAGGHSRLGQQTGATEQQSIAVVQRAVELGVNCIDTAEAYGTERIVGAALQGMKRQDLVLSTKKSMMRENQLIRAEDLIAGLERSLTNLQTDYIDIYHLHAVRAEHYDYAVAELVPALERLREQGKIRFLGITEAFGVDTGHEMLMRAVHDPFWDVMMVGFNILNQSARERVLVHTIRQQIGVMCMFAVRDALSRPEKLQEIVGDLVKQGRIKRSAIDPQNPLGFLYQFAESIPDAAYRFCRAEPGMHVILSGTGNLDHLEENIASILRPPLPNDVREHLITLFEGIDSVSGQ